MVKKILILFFFLFGTLSFGAGAYDKDIVVKNQSRNDKVKEVFKQMMNAYEEEDIGRFFSYVSEDRFEQDYMTFYDAIDQDIRIYDILNVDTWVDKITEDGIKRYLYVQWDKRYLASTSDTEIQQRGYSRFLFDEVNGKYKLIQLAGNNFWGKSLPEWREEVPQIAGQEQEDTASSGGLPDLKIISATCIASGAYADTVVSIKNQGKAAVNGTIVVKNLDRFSAGHTSKSYSGSIDIGQTIQVVIDGDSGDECSPGDNVKVDFDEEIIESDETNNEAVAIGS